MSVCADKAQCVYIQVCICKVIACVWESDRLSRPSSAQFIIVIELMLPLAFHDWLESILGSIMSPFLSFISSFILHSLSLSHSRDSLMVCFTFVLLPVFLYLMSTTGHVCSCALRVCFPINIKVAHRKGSDARMTTPLPFWTVTFSFVLSCLIPCFLNCLFFPLSFTTPFLSPYSHRTQGMAQNPSEQEMTIQTVWTLVQSESEYQQDLLALSNNSSQSFFKAVEFWMHNYFSYQNQVDFLHRSARGCDMFSLR